MDRANCELLKIPPRSPDLNTIENIFKLVSDALRKQAIRSQITKETIEEFKNRVISTIQSLPLEIINNTIASMPNRVKEIIKRKGQRLRY
jgi:predicted GTPase